ncbi:MAG: chemotaxis protein [Eubacterium sp.]|jgi:methyl-accepting chemotaxis protein|nr:chemotaxis protein [Eubacterium sp.]
MKDTFLQANTAKVNKIIAAILTLLFFGTAILYFNNRMPGAVIGSLLVELGFVGFLILRRKQPVLTMAILFMSILTITVPYIGGPYTGMVVVTVLCVVSLHLNKGILFSFGGLYSISYSLIYFTDKHKFDNDFYSTMVFFVLTVVVLYFVTKRSADLILLSKQKEAETKELLYSLDKMVAVIQENTLSLNTDINSCDKDIGTLRNISNIMADTIKDVTEGVVNQSESIIHISEMMNNADKEMSEINLLSKSLAYTSENAGNIVHDNSDSINKMGIQMHIINSAVTESLATVEELNKSMEDVNNFLSAINQISEQTNLLALNASIEAARAGEAGAGFSVVANEIKKLAQQSSNTVKHIDKIINDIHTKTQLVFEKAYNGNIAVKEGEYISKQVLDSFENIKSAFNTIDECIATELEKTGYVGRIFSQIREQAENISCISKKHSEATEEMLATTEEQNSSIEIIYESIKNINNSSIKLQELIEKRNEFGYSNS